MHYTYTIKGHNSLSNLYDYGFRWYNPITARFTGVDPIADEFAFVSGYNYAENSPIGNVDLWGLQALNSNLEYYHKVKRFLIGNASRMIRNAAVNFSKATIEYTKSKINEYEINFFSQGEVKLEAQAGGSFHYRGLGGSGNYMGEELLSLKLGTDENSIHYNTKNGNVNKTSGFSADVIVGGSYESLKTVQNGKTVSDIDKSTISLSVPQYGGIYGRMNSNNLESEKSSIEAGYSNKAEVGLFLNGEVKINMGIRVQKKDEEQ